jgi:alkylation response protein AidB-like acyl-CoA dehydrogenase
MDWKGILSRPGPHLTAEEQSFLDNEVEEFCAMLDPWKIEDELKDLPPEAWQYLKDKRFFGLCIPKEYGGHGFSAQAHSAIISKIQTRSGTGAVTTMVPNSLGPAELILHYGTGGNQTDEDKEYKPSLVDVILTRGTEDQKNYFLPRLAKGEEIPCFALTSPQAGSDATNQKDEGVIFQKDDGKLYIRLNWEKRYTTLAPVSTLLGLSFQLKDPKGLLGGETNYGITLALVPTNTPGVNNLQRHRPMGAPFQNGPHWGKDVEIPLENIIGGRDYAGKGWNPMLVDCLAIGRSISLPSAATGMARYAAFVAGGYAGVRQQFGGPIAKLPMVQEALARIGGMTYIIDSARIAPLQDLDFAHAEGKKARPAVASAILKYHLTEMSRKIVIDTMDIHGGKAVMEGPNNPIGHLYKSLPVGITVEGANFLTRGMMIFGQGAFMAHPYVLDEMKAGREDNLEKAGELGLKHITKIFNNAVKSAWLGITNGRFSAKPHSGPDGRFYQQINRLTASFAFMSDLTMVVMQQRLMPEERISARLGDAASNLYMAAQVLHRWNYEGRKKEDIPLMQWGVAHCLHEAENALWELTQNYKSTLLRTITKPIAFPRTLLPAAGIAASWAAAATLPPETFAPAGAIATALGLLAGQKMDFRHTRKPSDKLDAKVADLVSTPGPVRDRLTAGMYMPKDDKEYLVRLDKAHKLAQKAFPVEKTLYRAAKNYGRLTAKVPDLIEAINDTAKLTRDSAAKAAREAMKKELTLSIRNNLFNGRFTDLNYNDIPAVETQLKKVIKICHHNGSSPESCKAMMHTVLRETGESLIQNNPERDPKTIRSFIDHSVEIADRIALKGIGAQRDAFVDAITLRIEEIAGRLVPPGAAKMVAVEIGKEVAANKGYMPEDYMRAAITVVPKMIEKATLSQGEDYGAMVREAVQKKMIDFAAGEMLHKMNAAREDICQVDHFPSGWFGPASHRQPYYDAKPDAPAPAAPK